MATTTQYTKIPAKVQKRLVDYVLNAQEIHARSYNIRDKLEWKDRAYMREVDFSVDRWKAEATKRRGIVTKFQNIVIPVVLPQVEAAVTYQSDMFLSGYPIFATVADPDHIDAAQQMDTVIGNQQLRGGWVLEYQKTFRDGFKYNIMGNIVDWSRERTFAIANDQPVTESTASKLTELIWEGNTIKRADLYNSFWDTCVSVADVSSEGEFAGYMKLVSKVGLQRYMQNTLGTFNTDIALSAGTPPAAVSNTPTTYYYPRLNPEAIIDPDSLGDPAWVAYWTGDTPTTEAYKQLYSNRYQITTCYCRIVPSEYGLTNVPAPRVPQIWKLVIVNNKTLILAERSTNVHDKLPMVFAQAYDDGLNYQTKSLSDNVLPMQEISTALANSSMHARRRAISDRAIYDPMRISGRELANDSPTANIPVKPGAFGSKLSEAYYPIPFRDDQFQVNGAEMAQYIGLADTITGMNRARQGQFTKGNRTRAEFNSIMAFGSGRDRTTSQSLECSLFAPTKEIIKANILQYQPGVRLLNPETQTQVMVDPLALRKATLMFKLADGLLPSEKIMDGEALTMVLQTLQAVPALAQGYNVVPMFSYLAKMKGAKLRPFEKSPEQLAYEQAMQQWQQAIMGAAQTLSKNSEITPEMLQELAKQLPPQPKPADYNYVPGKQMQATDNMSVLQMVLNNGEG